MNRIFLIDIDGTICEDISNADSHLYSSAKPFMDAQKIINKWYHE
ncbi:phosphoheptose isomerase, partial [bacterium]|nr:phosphoheptose isomerase [bacterium]